MTSAERLESLERKMDMIIDFLGISKKRGKSKRSIRRQAEDHAIVKQLLKIK